MPEPGEIFYLPPGPGEPGGKGHRPYVLLGAHQEEHDLATLAYCSTQPYDASFGAEHIRLDMGQQTGFSRSTYIYTSRLITEALHDLPAPEGKLVEALPALKTSLLRALGVGTGPTRDRNTPGTNRRGRLVELTAKAEAEWQTRFALVVTQPEYSRFGYQQTVVPLMAGEFETLSLDIPLSQPEWLGSLADAFEVGLLAVPAVATLYVPDDLARFRGIVAPPEVMVDLDRALVAHFDLYDYV